MRKGEGRENEKRRERRRDGRRGQVSRRMLGRERRLKVDKRTHL